VRLAIGVAAATVVVGFALIAFGGAQTHSRTDVAAQAPYVVSAGLTGLALVAIGAGLVVVLVLRNVDRDRHAAIADLFAALQDAA
jgi:hypothetical protein